MANYHLQFDDNDVKNGLLNVDPDGCLKGVTPEKVLFTEKRDGVTYCCGIPAAEMTIQEALDLCRANLGKMYCDAVGGSLSLVASVMLSPKSEVCAAYAEWKVDGSSMSVSSDMNIAKIEPASFKQS